MTSHERECFADGGGEPVQGGAAARVPNDGDAEWTTVTSGRGSANPRRVRWVPPREPSTMIRYHVEPSAMPASSSSGSRKARRRRRKQQQCGDSVRLGVSLAGRVHAYREALQVSEWWATTKRLILDALGSYTDSVSFVQCLGLGSFEQSHASVHQLACAMLIQQTTGAAACSISDPIMTDADAQLARDAGLLVREACAPDEITIDDPGEDHHAGILFMPHCGRDVNIAVLHRWVERRRLDNVVYVGNCLTTYLEQIRDGQYDADQAEHLDRVSRLLDSPNFKQIRCPSSKLSPSEFAFNDLAIVHFGCTSKKELNL